MWLWLNRCVLAVCCVAVSSYRKSPGSKLHGNMTGLLCVLSKCVWTRACFPTCTFLFYPPWFPLFPPSHSLSLSRLLSSTHSLTFSVPLPPLSSSAFLLFFVFLFPSSLPPSSSAQCVQTGVHFTASTDLFCLGK